MKIDNLFQHTDGPFVCLISPQTPLQHPESGDWLPGVTYATTDGLMRSTSMGHWEELFAPVADYAGDDESVLRMIRRCNPGDRELDFVAVFESWHESEIGITGHMLELAVGAAMEAYIWGGAKKYNVNEKGSPRVASASLTIGTEDLQRVLQNYEIERVPEAHGFTFNMRKSFPDDG